MIDARQLRELLHYDPYTGVFIWKPRPRCMFESDRIFRSWNTKWSGKKAGALMGPGYVVIGIFCVSEWAHHLAWLYMTGKRPAGMIDHINGNRGDNRLENLRDVDNQTNSRNCIISKNNTSGVNGVYWCKRKRKWHARIKIDGHYRNLGYFSSLADAANVRKAADSLCCFTGRHGGDKNAFI